MLIRILNVLSYAFGVIWHYVPTICQLRGFDPPLPVQNMRGRFNERSNLFVFVKNKFSTEETTPVATRRQCAQQIMGYTTENHTWYMCTECGKLTGQLSH